MESKEFIDRLERVRDGFITALEMQRQNLPESALSAELAATRLANRTILDLETVEKNLKKKKS